MLAGGGGVQKPAAPREPETPGTNAPAPFRGLLGNKHVEANGGIAKLLAQAEADHY